MKPLTTPKTPAWLIRLRNKQAERKSREEMNPPPWIGDSVTVRFIPRDDAPLYE